MHCIYMQFDGKMTYNRDIAIISEYCTKEIAYLFLLITTRFDFIIRDSIRLRTDLSTLASPFAPVNWLRKEQLL